MALGTRKPEFSNTSAALIPLAFVLVTLLAGSLAAQEKLTDQQFKERDAQIQALLRDNKLDEALPAAQELLRLAEVSFGSEHANTATACHRLGLVYLRRNQNDEGERYTRRALAIREKVLPPGDPETANSLNNLGVLATRRQDWAAAEQLHARALAIREKALGPEHADVARSLLSLSDPVRRQGRFPEAEGLLRRALAIREKISGPEHTELIPVLYPLALICWGQSKNEDAAALIQRVIGIREKTPGEDALLGQAYSLLGEAYVSLRKPVEGEAALRHALAIQEKVYGANDPRSGDTLTSLGKLLLEKKPREAVPFLQRALALAQGADNAQTPEVADLDANLGLAWIRQGDPAKGEASLDLAVKILEKESGPIPPVVHLAYSELATAFEKAGQRDDLDRVVMQMVRLESRSAASPAGRLDLMSGMVRGYLADGRYRTGLLLAREVLKVVEKSAGPDEVQTATALHNLGELQYEMALYREAEPTLQRALAIREKKLSANHPEVAATLTRLAQVQIELGQYAKADAGLQRALEIRRAAKGAESPEVADTLWVMGNSDYQQANLLRGIQRLEQSRDLLEKAYGKGGHRDLIRVQLALASAYRVSRMTEEAGRLLYGTLATSNRLLGPAHPYGIEVICRLAAVEMDRRNFQTAHQLVLKCNEYREREFGKDNLNTASGLLVMARLMVSVYKYPFAQLLFEQALQSLEKHLGTMHPYYAGTLRELGQTEYLSGRYEEAAGHLEKALAIFEQVLGKDTFFAAVAANDLASAYMKLGRSKDAEPLLLRAVATYEKVAGPNHPLLMGPLNNLAGFYVDERKLDQAIALYERALAILGNPQGAQRLRLATLLNNIAVAEAGRGNNARAQELYRRALEILETAGGTPSEMRTTVMNLALEQYRRGAVKEADALFDRMFDLLRKEYELAFAAMSERDRLALVSMNDVVFPAYFSFALTHHKARPEVLPKMLERAIYEKGMVASSVAALRARIAASGDPAVRENLTELAKARQKLAALRNDNFEGIAETRKDWEDAIAMRETALAASGAGNTARAELAPIPFAGIRAALKPGDAVVEFVHFAYNDGKKVISEGIYVALVLKAGDATPTLITIGEAAELEGKAIVDDRARVATRGVVTAAGPAKEEAPPPGPPAGQLLYEKFWKPLEAALAGAKRVYVSPEGALNQIPIGILPREDGKLLMETYDLRILNSTSELLGAPRQPKANSAVLIGNPQFNLGLIEQKATAARLGEALLLAASAPGEAVPSGLRASNAGAASLNPLPGTEVEVRAIAPLLEAKSWQVTTYTQAAALEDAVKRVRSPRLLHIATHGFFQAATSAPSGAASEEALALPQDPMLRSGLYFAGADRALAGESSEDLEDGVLTASEGTALDLQGTELVVLSACETGLGDVQHGEGVFGLRRAFQVAGAEAVLMSLWSVPDRETQELMTRFYQKWLGGKDKHLALREAQMEMREVVRQRYGRDLPFYWGAFVMVGR